MQKNINGAMSVHTTASFCKGVIHRCTMVILMTILVSLLIFFTIHEPSAEWLGPQPDDRAWAEKTENKIAGIKESLNILWCRTLGIQIDGGFCITEEQLEIGGNEVFDPMLCSAVESLAGNGSIGDFGAGLGLYGMCLLRKKETPFVVSSKYKAQYMENFKKRMGEKYLTPKVVSSWDGFDGAGNIGELSGDFIRPVDLSEEDLWLGRQWDWVMSVEVGEHISARKEKFFLDNIVRHACKGVLLTWAVEGQGGHGHVNTRNNDYIRARMKERGLVNDIEEDNRIRNTLTIRWLRNTVMVFRFANRKICSEH